MAANEASERHFSLFIPGLLEPSASLHPAAEAGGEKWPPRSGGRAPALETVLARGERSAAAHRATGHATLEASLFRLFGLPGTRDADLPVAAVTRLADGGLPDDAWWLRADPVSLQPQGGGLVLQAGEALILEEARSLVEELLEVFAADGWHLEAPVSNRWYLRPATPPAMRTTPLAQVLGRDIHPFLPTGKDAKAWHVAMNEIQILLHTAGVNVARESRGLMPINSLWFWGGGQRPVLPPVSWAHLWSDEVLSRGLALAAGLDHSGLPRDADDWLARAAAGRHLLVMDTDTLLARAAETARWQEFFMRLEQHWMSPLVAALRSGAAESITLYSEGGQDFHLTRKGLGRWWRRRHAPAYYR